VLVETQQIASEANAQEERVQRLVRAQRINTGEAPRRPKLFLSSYKPRRISPVIERREYALAEGVRALPLAAVTG
jgi:hypothetical protein